MHVGPNWMDGCVVHVSTCVLKKKSQKSVSGNAAYKVSLRFKDGNSEGESLNSRLRCDH